MYGNCASPVPRRSAKISAQNHSLLDSEHFAGHLALLQTTPVIHDQLLERSLLLLGAAADVGAITPALTPGDQIGGANLNV